uniref:Uncharacterized protein n=1 Tax=Saccharum spontaneum TaxID=62335 RepID=A0A678T6E4_SACSP|nr:hypothetical protein SS47J13_000003 [Saccharum spontaneum]
MESVHDIILSLEGAGAPALKGVGEQAWRRGRWTGGGAMPGQSSKEAVRACGYAGGRQGCR